LTSKHGIVEYHKDEKRKGREVDLFILSNMSLYLSILCFDFFIWPSFSDGLSSRSNDGFCSDIQDELEKLKIFFGSLPTEPSEVHFTNILKVAFLLIFFCQKITKPNCDMSKALLNTFEQKKLFE